MKVLKKAGRCFRETTLPVEDAELVEAVQQQPIFWSDGRLCHWFFDFKFKGRWISCWQINNELTECVIDIFTP